MTPDPALVRELAHLRTFEAAVRAGAEDARSMRNPAEADAYLWTKVYGALNALDAARGGAADG